MTLNKSRVIMFLSLFSSSPLRCWRSAGAFQLSRTQTRHRMYRINTISTRRFAHSTNDYSSMKVSELRELLRERGLSVSGIKAELIERLTLNNEGISSQNDNRSLGQLKGGSDNLPGNIIYANNDDDEDDDPWDDYDDDEDDFDPNQTAGVAKPYDRKTNTNNTKRQNHGVSSSVIRSKDDFQTTRVFVQNIPNDCTSWKDLKDHFKVAGEVVYASISVDSRTGESKQCGIVQFETAEMAKTAIRIMRNHPMDGRTLFVREDVQEKRKPRENRGNGNSNNISHSDNVNVGYKTQLPTEWKRANDEDIDGSGKDWYDLKDEELHEIEAIIQKRDKQRLMKNYKMSDKLRDGLKEEFGVHLDDRLKLWWTDTKHGGVPGLVSEIKGEGRWGKQQSWRQIPTNPESDKMVDSKLVMSLLEKRDRARRMKDFDTADALLERAHNAPQGGLGLRIHDDSRTWRIWTSEKPQSKKHGDLELSPAELCLQIVSDNEPEKVHEMKALLTKFPGREWNILKKLRSRYNGEN